MLDMLGVKWWQHIPVEISNLKLGHLFKESGNERKRKNTVLKEGSEIKQIHFSGWDGVNRGP